MDLDLKDDFESKISLGNKLLNQVSSQFNCQVNGTEKLKKKIKQELSFLTKMKTSSMLKKEHIQCTNLHYFEALVSCALKEKKCSSILEMFPITLGDESIKRICVDIVSENGYKWTKVIARSAAALNRISVGAGEYGQKTVLNKAEEYIKCAQQHPHHFKPPLVVFHFASGISHWLAEEIERMGVTVTGDRLKDDVFVNYKDELSDSAEENISPSGPNILSDNLVREVAILNLDITTMIAYVSALTNGGEKFNFKDILLSQQASWERLCPVKPQLDNLFRGKQLTCCETAAKDFKMIVATIGGVSEKERTAELMSRITIVPDMSFNKLKIGGKIKSRSVTIFGTGHMMKALTVTANEGFVRAAKNQGIQFAVYVHESRALTEAKQEESNSLL